MTRRPDRPAHRPARSVAIRRRVFPREVAKHDAKDFRKWLLDPDGGGVPEENIKVVMADQARESTGLTSTAAAQLSA